MKKTFLSTIRVCLFVALATMAADAARLVVPSFDVRYLSYTNYSTGNGPSGLWLANIRGKKTWRDLVVANKNDNTVSVRLCRDAGNFNVTAVSYAVDLQPVAVIAADMNRDNYDDVISANFGTNTISLLQNQNNNTLGTATNFVVGTTPNPGPIALAAGNAAGSGRQDIFVANLLENSVTVLTNAGNCFLMLRSNISVGTGPIGIAFADFNNDGTGDIITANTNGTISILQGYGAAHFQAYSNITMFAGGDPQPSALGVGDFNMDGRIDLVVANFNSNSITILTNSLGNTFLVSSNYDVGSNPRALVLRDLNQDGITDIVVANEASTNVHIFLGNRDGTFSLNLVKSVASNPVGVAASNFNADNMSDIAVLCESNSTSILLYDLPLVYNDTITAYEDTAKSITLTSAQLTNAALTYSIVTGPIHGGLSGSGTSYTYTGSTNYFGTDSFTYKVNDGLVDSATGTNTIAVVAVNDAPSFSFSTNVITANKFAVLTYSNFIASSSAGPANESSQIVSYLTTSLGTTNLFLTRPTIRTNGVLTFRPSTNNFGTSTVTIIAQDNGGRSYGGTNQSLSQTFTIENPGPNPYLTLKGTYNGLFSEAAGVSSNSAGAFTFTLSNIGSYSGILSMKNLRYAFSGQFDTAGNAQSLINSATLTCAINFQLDVSNNTDQVTGTVTNGVWTADLLGDKLTFNATTNLAPLAGKYTLLIPGEVGSTNYPTGDGYGVFTIYAAGTVSFSGALADGTAVAATTYLSKNGKIPLYVPLFAGRGILTGWISVTNDITNRVDGTLSWSTGDHYVPGWNTNVAVIGSSYTVPNTNTHFLALTNAVITLRNGNLTTTLTNNATVLTNNNVTMAPNTNRIAVVFYPATGTVGGSFKHPVTLQTIQLKGTVLQQQKKVEGFFNASGVSGHLELAAP
ncbi:MAG: Alkaline phosphatase [Verrucomicrobiales bacterium]|nr:Alkaline phosphatase [Verrucomicrobiales bacterium]